MEASSNEDSEMGKNLEYVAMGCFWGSTCNSLKCRDGNSPCNCSFLSRKCVFFRKCLTWKTFVYGRDFPSGTLELFMWLKAAHGIKGQTYNVLSKRSFTSPALRQCHRSFTVFRGFGGFFDTESSKMQKWPVVPPPYWINSWKRGWVDVSGEWQLVMNS